MEITLNHTIIFTQNNIDTAKFYESVFGFEFVKKWGSFAVVKVNSTLALFFLNKQEFQSSHYAFKVTEADFDKIFSKVKSHNIAYGSTPFAPENGQINHNNGGRGVFFKDLNGHLLEVITQEYNLDVQP